MRSFTDNVLEIVKNIPQGSVLTYKQVAAQAGNSSAARAVGSIMRKNYRDDIPCHRVIRSDGRVGEYNRGGENVKLEKLKKEGNKIKKATPQEE